LPAARTRPQVFGGPPAVVPAAAAAGRAVLPPAAAAPAGITRFGTLTPTAARPASAKRKGDAMGVMPGTNTPAEKHGHALEGPSSRRQEPPARMADYTTDF
jgi:hypothetical protein